MKLHRVAPDLWRLALLPLDLLNVYLVEDVLLDSGGPFARRKLLRALGGHEIRAHAVTHAHLDHQGGSHAVCEALGIPLWCGSGDREALETGDLGMVLPAAGSFLAVLSGLFGGPPHPVSRVLNDGDEVGGFRVVETSGHTPGHLALWRENDGVLIIGDVLFHRNPVTCRPGLQEPHAWATLDPAANRESARKLALLEPGTVCFGHGAPLLDSAGFMRFVARLPHDAQVGAHSNVRR